jgi:hypothetical protein
VTSIGSGDSLVRAQDDAEDGALDRCRAEVTRRDHDVPVCVTSCRDAKVGLGAPPGRDLAGGRTPYAIIGGNGARKIRQHRNQLGTCEQLRVIAEEVQTTECPNPPEIVEISVRELSHRVGPERMCRDYVVVGHPGEQQDRVTPDREQLRRRDA